ncbi:DUF2752 domain-containing protein [Taibaiella sp. KBW10]|uniref:DUF2752 domain-containing protein n=1 Tax=Taibaiella sp. KBW10 TaxID=2153357 RepID=UPI0013155720|nr:DUF2752 domain-containing protein [Taibaiella sp. KBW10]
MERNKWYIGFGLLYIATLLLNQYTSLDISIPCLFKKAFGVDCPGCGLSRAVSALLQGDITLAWHHNALLFLLIPVLGYSLLQQWINIYNKIVHTKKVP